MRIIIVGCMLLFHVGMHVLDGIQADRDSGIVNYGDNNFEGEGLSTNKRVLILLLEQEILFIELTFPE